jgi:Fe-S-cluster containining protein
MDGVYVTLGDIGRIADYTGRDDFFEYRVPEDPVYLGQDDDPLWRDCVFRPDRSRRVLKRAPGGDCFFLGAEGCALPIDARPLACRLYPYQYDEQRIWEELSDRCPRGLLKPGESLTEALHMSLPQAQVWHQQLYRELRMEKETSCTSV